MPLIKRCGNLITINSRPRVNGLIIRTNGRKTRFIFDPASNDFFHSGNPTIRGKLIGGKFGIYSGGQPLRSAPSNVKGILRQIAKNAGVFPENLLTSHLISKADDGTSLFKILAFYKQIGTNGEKNMSMAEALAFVKEKFLGVKRINIDLQDPKTVKLLLIQIAKKAGVPLKDLRVSGQCLSSKDDNGLISLESILYFYAKKENNKEKDMGFSESLAFVKEKFLGIKRVNIDLKDADTVRKLLKQIAKKAGRSPEDLSTKLITVKADNNKTSLYMIISFYMNKDNNGEKEMSPAEALAFIKEKFLGVKRINIDLSDPKTVKRLLSEIAKNIKIAPADLCVTPRYISRKADDNRTSLNMIISFYQRIENNGKKNMSKFEALAYLIAKLFGVKDIIVDLANPEEVKRLLEEIAKKADKSFEELSTDDISIRANNNRTSLHVILNFYKRIENNSERDIPTNAEAIAYIKEKFLGIQRVDLRDPQTVVLLLSQIAKRAGTSSLSVNTKHLAAKADNNMTSLEMIVSFYQKHENNGEKDMSQSESLAYIKEKFLGISRVLDKNELLINEMDELGLTDAVSMLGNDAYRLQQYLNIFHPELSREKIEDLVIAAFHGLRAEWSAKTTLHEDYAMKLPRPVLDVHVKRTSDNSFTLSGKVAPGTPYLQLIGNWTRKIIPKADGTFSAEIPLSLKGELNEFILYSFDPVAKQKSSPIEIEVLHTGPKLSAEEAFEKLVGTREDLLAGIRKNPQRWDYMLRSMEQVYIRHFTYSVEAGFRTLEIKIRREHSPLRKALLEAVMKKFRAIDRINIPLREGERLYFFEKYCIYHILEARKARRKGVILANEPGMGKTMTVLSALNNSEAVIVAPNSVVTTWGEQGSKFFKHPSIHILEGPYAERDEQLRKTRKRQVVANIEFMRNMKKERADLLAGNGSKFIVIDESDYLGSKDSLQTEGTHMLRGAFKILMSATPFKRASSLCHILHFLYPDDPRFRSAVEFARAFPTNDARTLTALHLLLNSLTIRFRKRDVFESYDPKVPLEKQSDRLPKQVYVDPKETGDFSLTMEQCASILHLFTDFQSWCQTHKNKGRQTFEDKQYYHEGYFSKKEALRQIMNDPRYVGRNIDSPKHRKMDEIIGKELKGNGKKAIIFCRYRAQVEEYSKRYAEYGVCTYYGGMRQNSDGYKVDERGNVLYFKVDDSENYVFDANHELLLSNRSEGRPIRALDFERLMFQNNPNKRVFIATYDVGSLGITLSAADVVISDDLASTYRDQYQSDDRAHRIDNDRKKYHVKYYRLRAKYPKGFLEHLRQNMLDKFFSMGTFDEVHFDNLDSQKKIFHRILDGVGDERELELMGESWMKNNMPFLFENSAKKPE